MALEIGIQHIPASAMSSIKVTHVHEIERPSRATEPNSTDFQKVPEKQRENLAADVSNLRDAVLRINESIQVVRRELHFSVDEESGRVVIKVVNAEDGETIRQIPSEEMLQLARQFTEGETEGCLLKVIA